MYYRLQSPRTPVEWEKYYLFRWKQLRKRWNQPEGTEKDKYESIAYHLMAIDENNEIIGVGRIHKTAHRVAQIRYMAVSKSAQNNHVGSKTLLMLEGKAQSWNCKIIMLNARNTAVGFYQKFHYNIRGKGPLLFGKIAHTEMYKNI